MVDSIFQITILLETFCEFEVVSQGMLCCAFLSCFSHVQLFGPVDCSPPGNSVHGILQASILEWVALPSSSQGRPAPPPRACRPRPGRSRAPPGPARGRLGWTPGGGKQARPFEPSGTAVRGDLSAERHPFVNVSTFIECPVIARIAG